MRVLGRLAGYGFALLACVQAVYSLDTYDVIVVGSGPGGLIAAEYLSRDTSIKVLVLEAGPASLQASGGTDVPDYAQSKGFTKFDIPGEYDGAGSIFVDANKKYQVDYVDGRTMGIGQLVGGCSSLNGGLYFRPPDSYMSSSKWPFSADHVSQLFDEMEQIYGHTDNPSPDGQRYVQEGYTIVSQALSQFGGYSERTLNDPAARNAKTKTFGHPPFTFKDGLRDSPAKTCWGPMRSRSNVKLLTSARVSYIKQTKGKATGIVYNDNIEVGLSARGAVIMGAGALGTPKVLMQSGIGPSDQLNALNALGSKFPGVQSSNGNWLINENVGKSMFDTALLLPAFSHPNMKSFLYKTAPQSAKDQYMNQGQSGPLSFSGPLLIAYENYIVNGRLYEFQTTLLTNGFGDSYTIPNGFTTPLYINNPESRDYASFDSSGKYRAFTQGSLYMSTANDLAAMQNYAQKVVDMMQKAGATFLSAASGQSVADWVAAHRSTWETNHFGGTCYASSDRSDSKRCADESLRVVGSSNIYVSDASAMKDGTVNPYGFIMYIGREVGGLVKAQIAAGGPSTPSPTLPPTPNTGSSCSLENGIDYTGNDLASAFSASADGCCSICKTHSGCNAFTWTSYNGGTCWLKTGKGATTNNSGSISAVLGSSASSTCSKLESNVDYSGPDIGQSPSAQASGCCSICQARADCKAFSWTSYSGGTCWLKSAKGSTRSNNGAISGTVGSSAPQPACSTIEENVDYSGDDIANVWSAAAEGCCAICQARSGCGAFTWTSYNGGTCWLKSTKGSTGTNTGARSGTVNSVVRRTTGLHMHMRVHSSHRNDSSYGLEPVVTPAATAPSPTPAATTPVPTPAATTPDTSRRHRHHRGHHKRRHEEDGF